MAMALPHAAKQLNVAKAQGKKLLDQGALELSMPRMILPPLQPFDYHMATRCHKQPSILYLLPRYS